MSAVEVVADVALVAGAAMSMFAGIAVLRFPGTAARVHAATKPQVLGVMLLMLGVGLRLGTWAVAGQLVLIVILQLATAPVSAHLVVSEAYRENPDADALVGDLAQEQGADEQPVADPAGESGADSAGDPTADDR